MKPKKARVSSTNREDAPRPHVKSMDEHIEELQAENTELNNVIDKLRVGNDRLFRTLEALSEYIVNLRSELRALRPQVTQWRPIAEYDAMTEKPKGFIVFRAAESKNGKSTLPATISKDRRMGFRMITHFYVLPEIP